MPLVFGNESPVRGFEFTIPCFKTADDWATPRSDMPEIEPGLSAPPELDADQMAAITMEVAASDRPFLRRLLVYVLPGKPDRSTRYSRRRRAGGRHRPTFVADAARLPSGGRIRSRLLPASRTPTNLPRARISAAPQRQSRRMAGPDTGDLSDQPKRHDRSGRCRCRLPQSTSLRTTRHRAQRHASSRERVRLR